MTDDEFRCSLNSRDDDEPLAGTAPTDAGFLFVEHAGSWGSKALAQSRLPQAVKDHLDALPGLRVQLIRRYGGVVGPGVRVFLAVVGDDGFVVTTTVLPAVDDVVSLDLARDLSPYERGLWLVCTNGRRDRCCAEFGRPVAAALAARWPEETWETTHLGGHRFAATLLALPSGHTLGRLDVENSIAACHLIEQGRVPVELSRGRAGRSRTEQVRELRALSGAPLNVEILEVRGPERRQSCGDITAKPTTCFEVRA